MREGDKMREHRHYPVIVEQDEDGVFIVECPSFVGCRSYGHTIDDAMANIQEAIAACYEEGAEATGTTFIGVRDVEVLVS